MNLRERIERLPGMDRLLPALDGLPPAYLVGGAVRDLLRGEEAPLDLDVAVEGDAAATAQAVAERVGGTVAGFERFGTARVTAEGLVVDFAQTRSETYASPGALPEVGAAPLAEDLGRRDFSLNAMAAGLSGADVGELHDPFGGRADLEAGRIRVLHDRSFVDDPTRILRALRYEARLGGRIDAHTEDLARAAIESGALRTVSGKRLRVELIALLAEPEMPEAIRRLCELGLDRALYPNLLCDPDRAASAALGAAEVGADRPLAVLATLIAPDADALHPWLDRMAFPRGERERVARAANRGPHLAHELRPDMAASELYELLRLEPLEGLAVALAWGAPGDAILRYLGELRGARLEVTGDDLVAAGVPPSAALGHALEETLRRKLDGEVSGRDAELAMALELARR
ncbi:MAG: hypothetical protein QOG63_2372 [Thermoleophilaceae bacterium]|nr:hypothetical protein [Thermoleophilaceae bacterium]